MRAVHYRSEQGSHLALLGTPGRKFTQMVLVDYPVRVTRVLNDDAVKYSRDMERLTVEQLAKDMKDTGARFGITVGARKLIAEALA